MTSTLSFKPLPTASLALETLPGGVKNGFSRLRLLAGAAFLVGVAPFVASPAFADSIHVTIENPTVQETTSSFSSVGIENFNSLSLGAQTITSSFSTTLGSYALVSGLSGTLSNAVIANAGEFGGAGGTGKYITVNNVPSPITISLNKGVNYFGIWISAMNNGNVVSLYSGNTLLYSFDTASMTALVASNSAYYGNPNFVNTDMAEPFAFVNFYDSTGTFTKVVVSGTGFESDNYTVGTYTHMSGTAAAQSIPNIVSDNNGAYGYNTVSTLSSDNYNLRFDGGTLLVDTATTVNSSFAITSNSGHIDQNGLPSVFTGLFSDNTAGAGGRLIITNSGTGGAVMLANASNSYTGGTEVEAGATLEIASAGAIGSGTLSLVGTDTTPATLATTADMTIGNAITVTGDPVFDVASGTTTTISSVISGTGDVEVSGGGTLALTNTNSYTGPTKIDNGATLALSGEGSIASSSAVTNNGTFDLSSASSVVTLGGAYTQGGTGNLVLTAAPNSFQKLSVPGLATLDGGLTLVAASGAYSIGKYYLISSEGVSGGFSSFTNNFSSVTPLGYLLGYDSNGAYLYLTPNADATLQGIKLNAKAMSSVINAQSAALQAGLSYDCSTFDANDMCVSVGGRATHAEGSLANDTQAGLVVFGYRPASGIRLGAFLDRSFNDTPANVKLRGTNPMWGLFGNWAAKEDGTGLNIQVSSAFSSNDLSINRAGSSVTEAGHGNTTLDNQAYQLQANYVQPVSEKTAVIPYAGLRYLNNNIGAYNESANSDVLFPISFKSTEQNVFSALAGASLASRLADKLTGSISAGLIQNLSYSMDSYAGSSFIPGVTTFSAAMPDHVDTMATVGGRLSYDVTDTSRLAFNAVWQQQSFVNANTTSAILTYSMGF